MGLSDSEKSAVASLWEKIAPQSSKLGAESMERLFQSHPDTKSFFSRYDMSPGSADLLRHGGNIFGAIGEATKGLDSLKKHQDLHTNKLKLSQDHMKLISIAIVEVLSSHFGGDFNQAAWEKFLSEVGAILTSS
ncbi:PREDICTED: hemoglobin heart muscle subunit alpha-type-like [Nanorana parkeri]|uniref:hemoglobin heart muscle subunit alpha-type-like n=1 Tax=Nanorana parkeri TaxID=125878 RepID=UPI000854A67C|nr:PREDICTED: hemoglobin heart muscle subunit alpha-type-like [Nanorana parkeri]